MENQKLMSLIADKISAELDWSSYVGEKEKKDLVEEVITMFTEIMEKSIMNIVEE